MRDLLFSTKNDVIYFIFKRNYFVFQIHAITMENVWRQFRAIDVFVKLDSKENNVQVRAKSLKLLLNILLR